MKHTELKKQQRRREHKPVIVSPPPADKMYPLGPGWRVLRHVVCNLVGRSHEIAARWIDRAVSLRYLATLGSWLRKWTVRPLIISFYVAACLQYLPHILLALLFLLLYPPFLLAWLFIALIAIVVLRASQGFGNIGYHCPACYKSISAPGYLCPTCKAEHTRLQPGISGVFVHRCIKCATHLPTLDLFGRKQLVRLCPHCHCVLSSDLGTGPSIHIALVGGSAAGKTSYLIRAFQALKQSKSYGLQIAFADTIQEQAFEKDLRRLQKKQPPASASALKPRAWVLKMRFPLKLLPRLLYLYDPAGEAFRASAYTALQEYYSFLDGILFIVNPLALPTFQQRHEESSVGEDAPSHSVGVEVMQVYERMMQMFEISVGFSAKRRYRQPVAVVVTRTDVLRPNKKQPTVPEHLSTEYDLSSFFREANHHSLREFLCASGLDNFVRDLESHFAQVQYFSCSTMEDLSNSQDSTASEWLLQPLHWLLRTAQKS